MPKTEARTDYEQVLAGLDLCQWDQLQVVADAAVVILSSTTPTPAAAAAGLENVRLTSAPCSSAPTRWVTWLIAELEPLRPPPQQEPLYLVNQ